LQKSAIFAIQDYGSYIVHPPKSILTNESDIVIDEKKIEHVILSDKLGDKFEIKLGLNKTEKELLNNLSNTTNTFLNIEECCIVVINLFLQTLSQLPEYFTKENTSLNEEIKSLEVLVIQRFKEINTGSYDWDNYNSNLLFNTIEKEVYQSIFRKSENGVRIKYGENRKINDSIKYLNDVIGHSFEKRIGGKCDSIINNLTTKLQEPRLETQIELNSKNGNRWRIEFERLKLNCNEENINSFYNGISELERSNQKNLNIGGIFFEASKLVAKIDKKNALKYYLNFVYYEMKFKRFSNRSLPKNLEKELFRTDEENLDFLKITNELCRSLNISKAFDDIEHMLLSHEPKTQLGDLGDSFDVVHHKLENGELINKNSECEFHEDYGLKNNSQNEHDSKSLLERNNHQTILDKTIIDISCEQLNLSVEKNIESNSSFQVPPNWSHSYVYSYDELRHANKEQRKFYFYFKDKVLAGEYVDIKGNTNYAFILYFDLLNEYQSHQDIKLLDEQFKLLAEICPKTRSYSFRSLQDELRKRNDSYSVDKLKDLEEPNYLFENGFTDYNPDLYKLGNLYKEKLGLNKQEINWLNKFYNPSNVFTSIEGCCLAVINVYLAVFNELNLQLKDIDSSIGNEMDKIFEKVCEIENLQFNSYNVESEKRWATGRLHEGFFITFYKTIENLVREKYGHKRKLTFENYYPYSKTTQYIDEVIGNKIQTIINEKIQGLNEPDLETKIALNTLNVNRWKIEFDILTNDFKKEEQEKFIDAIITLEETNQKNSNIENIFFDASKFIAKYDKVQALKYYAKYIYYDLKSEKFDNKEFSKTVQKSLFKSEEQINDFKEIIDSLTSTKDIQTALEKISKIYAPKRKKIRLDLSEIEEVEQKHEDTVELLNEYLKDEKAKHETRIVDNSDDNTEITIVSSKENNSIFISEISIGQVQEELVKMIINNSFKIHQAEVDKFATANGMFKNQLIDSINEACEEYLDGEALIQEEDENYIIEESYYKEITK
jgi:hypothetical protein